MTGCRHCQPAIPPGARPVPSKLTEDEALAVPCTTCGADAGESCDFSYYVHHFLGMFVRGAPNVHTARYALGVRVKEARGRRAERTTA